jgi:hypothetical protein
MKEHTMIEAIAKCCCIARRQLGLHMNLYQRVIAIHGTASSELDGDINLHFMARLDNCLQLPDMKMMGAPY